MKIEVSALYVYPVKSLAGIALDQARLGPQGLAHDRRWMLVREGGRFVSQRENAALALLRCQLDDRGLTLLADGLSPLRLDDDGLEGHRVPVSVWKDQWEALDAGDRAADWVTRATGSAEPLRLVRMTDDVRRPQGRPDRYGEATTTGFADGAPYLVASTASLACLNAALVASGKAAVPMNRFRPNIVLEGLEAFAEHGIRTVDGPGYQLSLCDPCERCVITTIDQATGRPDPGREPFVTLARLNSMPGKPRSPAFAENAVLTSGDGQQIRVGDPLRVEQRTA